MLKKLGNAALLHGIKYMVENTGEFLKDGKNDVVMNAMRDMASDFALCEGHSKDCSGLAWRSESPKGRLICKNCLAEERMRELC